MFEYAIFVEADSTIPSQTIYTWNVLNCFRIMVQTAFSLTLTDACFSLEDVLTLGEVDFIGHLKVKGFVGMCYITSRSFRGKGCRL